VDEKDFGQMIRAVNERFDLADEQYAQLHEAVDKILT